MTRRDRDRDDALLVLGWRVGAIVLLVLDAIVAVGVPVIALVTGHIPPSGAPRTWLYTARPGWPPFIPPSFPWWIGAAGAVAFAVAYWRRASPTFRSNWGMAVAGSWFLIGALTAMVGGLFFQAAPAWPHDVLWAGCVTSASAVVVGIAARADSRRGVSRA